MPHAVLILAANGRLLFANERAEVLLSRGDGLRLREGRLVAGHPAEVPRLDEVLCQAARARTRPVITPRTDLHLRQRSAPAPLRISVAPLHEADGPQPLPARAAVLVLVEPPT